MKILLINPIVREWAKPNCFPLGLGYIASICRNKNWDVKVLDLNAERDKQQKLPLILTEYKPDLIGITGIITQYSTIKDITYICRVNCNADIIVGGPIASTIDYLLLNKTKTNICVHGEAEETIKEFLDAFEQRKSIESIKGISYMNGCWEYIKTGDRNPIKDIDSLPYPAWDLFPMDVYLNAPIAAQNRNKWIDGNAENIEKSFNIVGTRGCPYSCVYCYHNFMGQGYRKRDSESIVEEIKILKEKYGVKYIHFTDDAFALDKKYISDFCDKIKDLEVQWSCAGRVNMVDDEIVSKMKNCGCVGLCFGLESGSQKMLKSMNKKATIAQYKEAIRLNKKYFDYEDYTFIVGTIGETDETVQESIDFCKETNIVPSAVFFMTPYPGTPLFELLVKENKINIDDLDTYEKYIMSLGEQGEQMLINLTDYSDEKIYEWHDKFLKETKAWNSKKHQSKK